MDAASVYEKEDPEDFNQILNAMGVVGFSWVTLTIGERVIINFKLI